MVSKKFVLGKYIQQTQSKYLATNIWKKKYITLFKNYLFFWLSFIFPQTYNICVNLDDKISFVFNSN